MAKQKRRYRLSDAERARRSKLMKRLTAEGRCGSQYFPHIRKKSASCPSGLESAAELEDEEDPKLIYVNLRELVPADANIEPLRIPPRLKKHKRQTSTPLPLWKNKQTRR
jgi:hypothetical protein